jgi:hypothetical protein
VEALHRLVFQVHEETPVFGGDVVPGRHRDRLEDAQHLEQVPSALAARLRPGQPGVDDRGQTDNGPDPRQAVQSRHLSGVLHDARVALRRRERAHPQPDLGREGQGGIQLRRGQNRLGAVRRGLRARHPPVHIQGGRRHDTQSAEASVQVVLGVQVSAGRVGDVHVALPHVTLRPVETAVGQRPQTAHTLSQNAAICIDNH